jgi:hypothetical protein
MVWIGRFVWIGILNSLSHFMKEQLIVLLSQEPRDG